MPSNHHLTQSAELLLALLKICLHIRESFLAGYHRLLHGLLQLVR